MEESLPNGAKLGFKFELLPRFGGAVKWDDAVVYLDSVHIFNMSHPANPTVLITQSNEEESDTPTPTLTVTTTISISTPTALVPTAIAVSARIPTLSPTPTSVLFPAPVLVSPDEGALLSTKGDVKLEWEWEGDLGDK